jgi:O-methyltransferase involved in polyketide biosynthesis
MYTDRDRAEVAARLDGHGWRTTVVSSRGEMQRLGRLVESSTEGGDAASSTFVVAERG